MKIDKAALFLDYDGTLTPIVADPRQARLSEPMRALLKRLATKMPVTIISGRDRNELERLVGLEEICYVGSHGYELPSHRISHDFTPLLNRFERQIAPVVEAHPGVVVERKRFSVAIHYRCVAEEDQEPFKTQIEAIGHAYDGMRWGYGKKVLELLPDLDWNKGKALLELLQEGFFPIYIGDDLTDEDAFKVLKKHGMGILVSEVERETAATKRLADVGEVERFLTELADDS